MSLRRWHFAIAASRRAADDEQKLPSRLSSDGRRDNLTMVSASDELERLESRWRHVGVAVLAFAWLLVFSAIVYIPLGVVADTDCGTLLDVPSSGICDGRVHPRQIVIAVFVLLTVLGLLVAAARRRQRHDQEQLSARRSP